MAKQLHGQQLVDQIVARLTKGYAFRAGTYEEKKAYHDGVAKQVQDDYTKLPHEDFDKKYHDQIHSAVRIIKKKKV